MTDAFDAELAQLISAIWALQRAMAERDGEELTSRPLPPATQQRVGAVEASRGFVLAPAYRAFLSLHDGWRRFAWGMSLRVTEALTGDAYARGALDDDEDEAPLPDRHWLGHRRVRQRCAPARPAGEW